MIDPATKLVRKDLFSRLLDLEVKKALRYQYRISLLIMDIHMDVREQAPWGGSDQAVTALLRNCVRRTDIVGKLEDNKFSIILPFAEEETARIIGERISRRISAASSDKISFHPAGARVSARSGIFKELIRGGASPVLERKPREDTEVYSHRELFNYLLELEILRCSRYRSSASLLSLAGKSVLHRDTYRSMASAVRKVVRETDVVGGLCRRGFHIILPYTQPHHPRSIAVRISNLLNGRNLSFMKDRAPRLRVSGAVIPKEIMPMNRIQQLHRLFDLSVQRSPEPH